MCRSYMFARRSFILQYLQYTFLHTYETHHLGSSEKNIREQSLRIWEVYFCISRIVKLYKCTFVSLLCTVFLQYR
jgi:hypothetical protein